MSDTTTWRDYLALTKPGVVMLLMAPAAGVFFLGAGFADQWPGFIAAVSVGTGLTMIACGLLLKMLTRGRKQGHD